MILCLDIFPDTSVIMLYDASIDMVIDLMSLLSVL